MSSTDLDAPSLRLIFAAIAIVVGLHVLTAVALVTTKTPEIIVEPKKEKPPIEIELVTPPPIEIEVLKTEEKIAKPVRKMEPKPKAIPKPRPIATPKPTPIKPPQPIAKKIPRATPPKARTKSTANPAKPSSVKVNNSQPSAAHTSVRQAQAQTNNPDKKVVDDQRRILAAQAEQARQDTLLAEQQKAQADAIAAKVKAAADAKSAQEIADAKAADAKAKEAEAAQVKAGEAEAQIKSASNNAPVNFKGSDAVWIVEPDFGDISETALTLTLQFNVTKRGDIKNINVMGINDRSVVTKVQRRLKRSKVKPFIENGIPVEGIVNLRITVKP